MNYFQEGGEHIGGDFLLIGKEGALWPGFIEVENRLVIQKKGRKNKWGQAKGCPKGDGNPTGWKKLGGGRIVSGGEVKLQEWESPGAQVWGKGSGREPGVKIHPLERGTRRLARMGPTGGWMWMPLLCRVSLSGWENGDKNRDCS